MSASKDAAATIALYKYGHTVQISSDLRADAIPAHAWRGYMRRLLEGDPIKYAARQAFEAAQAGGLL